MQLPPPPPDKQVVVTSTEQQQQHNISSHIIPSLLSIVESTFTVANVVTYFRLFLLIFAAVYLHPNYPLFFVLLSTVSMLLDYVDGCVARWFSCSTKFGAMLDVAVDILTRSLVLFLSSHTTLCCILASLECLTFICTQQQTNNKQHWKDTPHNQQAPPLVCAIMDRGLRSPCGVVAVIGLFGLPLWAYIHSTGAVTSLLLWILLAGARCVAAVAELWYIANHIRRLSSN
eukprot:GHVS01049943.1.p1 GENE.GHVS01049943.1~~GHVS01049943.1.p1  ORF type:complete len:230 (-),score=39.56 GHVS01049943.1:90-779(-)